MSLGTLLPFFLKYGQKTRIYRSLPISFWDHDWYVHSVLITLSPRGASRCRQLRRKLSVLDIWNPYCFLSVCIGSRTKKMLERPEVDFLRERVWFPGQEFQRQSNFWRIENFDPRQFFGATYMPQKSFHSCESLIKQFVFAVVDPNGARYRSRSHFWVPNHTKMYF